MYLCFKLSKSKKTKIYQTIISVFLISTIFLFNIDSITGMFVGYSQGSIHTRSDSLNNKEIVAQLVDIVFDTLQKSTLILSVLMFLPVFKDISYFFEENPASDTLEHFIIFYSFIRILLYPLIYIQLRDNVEIANLTIDILYFSECILLIYIFVTILVQYRRILNRRHCLYRFRRIVFESTVNSYNHVLLLLLIQLIIDLIYKIIILITSISHEFKHSNVLIDYAYVLRIVSINLLLYCVLKIIFAPSLNIFDSDKNAVEEEDKNNANEIFEYVEPKIFTDFPQPNTEKNTKFNLL